MKIAHRFIGGCGGLARSPVGTTEKFGRTDSVVPTGLAVLRANPAINCWATISQSLRDEAEALYSAVVSIPEGYLLLRCL